MAKKFACLITEMFEDSEYLEPSRAFTEGLSQRDETGRLISSRELAKQMGTNPDDQLLGNKENSRPDDDMVSLGNDLDQIPGTGAQDTLLATADVGGMESASGSTGGEETESNAV